MKKNAVLVKGSFRKNRVIVLGLLMLFCFAGVLQAADSRFQEAKVGYDSILRDSTTGLEWQRCAYGERWTGLECSGTAWTGIWEDALRLKAPGGFRLPSIDELKTLAPYDQSVFPGAYLFWSSSPYAGNRNDAWGLYFDVGCVASSYRYNKGHVRLVRSGQ